MIMMMVMQVMMLKRTTTMMKIVRKTGTTMKMRMMLTDLHEVD